MRAPTRRELIADAAITTLARDGGRGLTHRAVDQAAGLSEGSTSYYFRTRASLLGAIVDRLAALDAASVQLEPDRGAERPSGGGPEGRDPLPTLVPALMQVVTEQLGPGRERLLARYELALDAVRRPDLRAALAAGKDAVSERVAGLLAAAGAPDPAASARDLLTMLDGLLLEEVTGTGSGRSPAQLAVVVRSMLLGCGVRDHATDP